MVNKINHRGNSVKLGKRIRSIRRSKDMDQETLAGNAGVSRSYLSLVERGQIAGERLSIGYILKITKCFGMTVNELLDGVEFDSPDSD